ncbi:MAG: DUF6249 domain-containing protein [Ignavibacteria bacterium]|nr:DUF6249 domain-containing protein [Ignavibacteria bacterium]
MDISETIIPIMGIIFGLGLPALIVYWSIYTRHRERMRLIEKGLTADEVKNFFKEEKAQNPYRGLKFGIILLFLGAGIILANLMYDVFELSDGYTGGFLILFLGLGFLTYYLIIKNKEKKSKEL